MPRVGAVCVPRALHSPADLVSESHSRTLFPRACTEVDQMFWMWWDLTSDKDHGTLLQYSCLENPLGWRGLVGCSPWGG